MAERARGEMGQTDAGRAPRLVIPLGDPAGIGTEVVLKALAMDGPWAGATIALVGDRELLMGQYDQLRRVTTAPLANPADWPIVDVPVADRGAIAWGQPNGTTGAAGFAWLDRAIAETLAGRFDAIVTAPIAKAAWHAAGHHYPGQTEVLAQRAGANRFGMMFAARSPRTGWILRSLLATTHIPLATVPATLTPDLLNQKLELLIDTLATDFGVAAPHIAIAGLNPHSGEGGKLGHEERDWMDDWLRASRDRHPQVKLVGLVPPDTLWVGAGRAWFGDDSDMGEAKDRDRAIAHLPDAYLALYHDQGLIPVKLMAFDRAVNLTVGLPFVRTSPDHGTAFDIAGQGIARGISFAAALDWAIALVQRRQTAPPQPSTHPTPARQGA
ncbi:MAG: 4-hydroxythreonine-4-phosphate dehydrogenase PdxA [Cyanobacteria bacterium]|nr:4-hydroxythreonine-4-phosphate dehydrogenase PdxA [Cyanobacteriota bacterium]